MCTHTQTTCNMAELSQHVKDHCGDRSIKRANMPELTRHVKERCADRSIKQAYIDVCMRKGDRSNQDETRYRYYYKGLCVIAVAALTLETQTVITAYWTSGYDGLRAYQALEADTHRHKEKQRRVRDTEKYRRL